VLHQHGRHPPARQFLANARRGREEVRRRGAPPAPPALVDSVTMGWRPAAPPPRRADPGALTPDALAAREQQLAQSPDDPADRADVLRYLNRPEESLDLVDRALRLDEANADAWYVRGLALGRFLDGAGEGEVFDWDASDEAVESLDRALLLLPDFFEARLYKGRTLYRACHAAQARLRALAAAVAHEQTGEEAARAYLRPYQLLFQCYFDRARESLQAAARLRPGDAGPWHELGRVLVGVREGFEDAALEAFTRAGELRPDLADAWYQRARLHSARGDRGQALADLRRAVAADPALADRAREDFDWLPEGAPERGFLIG